MKRTALAAPYLVWMGLFTIIPLCIVFYFAFTDSVTGSFTLINLLSIGNYIPIFLRSIWLALVSTVICFVLAYPVAWFIAGCSPLKRRFLYMLVMLPMCISFLLRTLAWVALMEDTTWITAEKAVELGLCDGYIQKVNTSAQSGEKSSDSKKNDKRASATAAKAAKAKARFLTMKGENANV